MTLILLEFLLSLPVQLGDPISHYIQWHFFFFFFSRDMLRPVEEEDRLLCGSQEATTANLPLDDSQIFKESNAREKNRKFFLP